MSNEDPMQEIAQLSRDIQELVKSPRMSIKDWLAVGAAVVALFGVPSSIVLNQYHTEESVKAIRELKQKYESFHLDHINIGNKISTIETKLAEADRLLKTLEALKTSLQIKDIESSHFNRDILAKIDNINTILSEIEKKVRELSSDLENRIKEHEYIKHKGK